MNLLDWQPPRLETLREAHSENDPAVQEIEERGFKVLGKLGSGQSRDVYKVQRVSGEIVEELVAKIRKSEIDVSSIQTRIAAAKPRDYDKVEVEISNQIWHPNVARILYTLQLSDGRRVNFEPYFEGSRDLKDEVKILGKFKDKDRFKKTLEQIVDGVSAIHERKFSHRDLKPSNIIITKNGAIVTDLQTVGKSFDYSTFPTRGGTAYTERRLLNALFSPDIFARAEESNDVYAIGGIAYFMLTGEDPSDIVLEESQDGTPIEVGGETLHVRLRSGEKTFDRITKADDEKRLKKLEKRMKEFGVSGQYRNFVLKCMRRGDLHYYHKNAISNLDTLKREIGKLDSGLVNRLTDEILEKVPVYLGVSAAAGALGIGFALGSLLFLPEFLERHHVKTVPAIEGALMQEDNRKLFLSDLPVQERAKAYEILAPSIDRAEEILPFIERQGRVSINNATFAETVHAMNPRFVISWMRSCYINSLEGRMGYQRDGIERYGDFLTYEYAYEELPGHKATAEQRKEDLENIGIAIQLLKKTIDPGRTIADIYTNYFSGESGIRTAIAKTGCTTYFPTVTPEGIELDKGYRQGLPEYQRKLIETAVGLYEITDEDCDIHWNRLSPVRKMKEEK